MAKFETGIQQEQPSRVESFTTAKGSIYTYGKDGRTTRFKTATKEQQPTQDITVFVDLSPAEEQQVLHAYRHVMPEYKGCKVYVLELNEKSGSPKIVRHVSQVEDPNQLLLVILNGDKYELVKKATLTPTMGCSVFDSRHYQQDGKSYTERHLGNRVVDIQFSES